MADEQTTNQTENDQLLGNISAGYNSDPSQWIIGPTGLGTTTTMGPSPEAFLSRVDLWEAAVIKKSRRHKNKKYWYRVSVADDGLVHYKVYYKGWWTRVFGRFHTLIQDWRAVTTRSTIESTIGAMYLDVDSVVNEDIKSRKKHKHLRKILNQAPEDNLRMISELEKLDKGSVSSEGESMAYTSHQASSRVPGLITSAQAARYAQTFTVSGEGTYFSDVNDASMENIRVAEDGTITKGEQ